METVVCLLDSPVRFTPDSTGNTTPQETAEAYYSLRVLHILTDFVLIPHFVIPIAIIRIMI